MPEYITGDKKISSNTDGEDSDEKILTKKIKYRMCLVFIFSKTLNEENVIIYKTFLVIQKILI